jgi:hypothetical protein
VIRQSSALVPIKTGLRATYTYLDRSCRCQADERLLQTRDMVKLFASSHMHLFQLATRALCEEWSLKPLRSKLTTENTYELNLVIK